MFIQRVASNKSVSPVFLDIFRHLGPSVKWTNLTESFAALSESASQPRGSRAHRLALDLPGARRPALASSGSRRCGFSEAFLHSVRAAIPFLASPMLYPV